jgi:ABC-type multidrug transport system fused ATPase/permease subunit
LFFELSAVLGLSFFVVLSVYNGKDINNLIAVLSVFLLAAFRLIPSSNRILTHIQAIKYASVAVDFLYNELNKFKSNYNIKDNKKILFNLNMPIVVQNLSYSYPNTKINAINNINISIPQGSFVGTTGNITIDGINIHKNTSGWMQNIGYVPQTIHLSDTSLRNNIAFGLKDDEIDDVKLTKALKEAELFEFVNSLSEGVFTNVGERGSKLSGGQRQRIGIARALYNDPQLLIFDEGTSALDSITEKSIINSILKFKNKKTIIMIAHRHSTLSECEMILEFNQSNMKINE